MYDRQSNSISNSIAILLYSFLLQSSFSGFSISLIRSKFISYSYPIFFHQHNTALWFSFFILSNFPQQYVSTIRCKKSILSYFITLTTITDCLLINAVLYFIMYFVLYSSDFSLITLLLHLQSCRHFLRFSTLCLYTLSSFTHLSFCNFFLFTSDKYTT